MLSDILAVFVVTLISSLILHTTSVHGLPKSPLTQQYIQKHPSTDLFSLLRHSQHHPVQSVDYDLGGDIYEMLIGESNELLKTNDQNDGSSSSSSIVSSPDASNESFDIYLHPSSSKSLSRKVFISLQKQHQQEKEDRQQKKRTTPTSFSGSSSLPTQFNLNSGVAEAVFSDPSHANSVVNFSQLSESTRLSPSLKAMLETNPFARAWLTILLQKVMEDQPVPYIFKYGRRRKK